MENKALQQNLEFLKERRENEFACSTDDGILYPANFFFPLPEWEEEIGTEWAGEFPYFIIPQHIIETLAPEKINLRSFWSGCVEMFPQISMCGLNPKNMPNEHTIEEINQHNIQQMENNKLHNFYQSLFENVSDPLILEIGPGFGALPLLLEKYNLPTHNYWAIDINYFSFHDNFYLCDGCQIPPEIPTELDNVIALNVFQHLSPAQRSSYFSQIAERLKVGGTFIFSMFLRDESNENGPFWSYRDEENNFYCYFFNQFTKVSTKEETIQELTQLGFEVVNFILQGNISLLVLVKKKTER